MLGVTVVKRLTHQSFRRETRLEIPSIRVFQVKYVPVESA